MRKLPIICSLLALAALAAKEAGVFAVLKSDAAAGKQPSGVFLISTNQLLRPWGEQTLFPGRPVDITFDSKKRVLAILNTRSVLLMDGSTGTQVAEIKARSMSYTGVAFRPGDRELWASEATRNGPDSILVAGISDLGLPGASAHIELEGHPVPAGIASSRDGATAYVAFSRNNSLAVIDTATRKITREIPVGIAPFGVVLSRQGTLYVACAGTNALAVVRTGKWAVLGAVPTAWFPSAMAVDAEGGVRLVNIKGVGNTSDHKGTFNTHQYEGMLERIPAPVPAQVDAGTREVQAANSPQFEPAGGVSNLPSLGIQHVFFVIKENRTYDQVLGDIPKGNGDPKLVFYGRDITPNHHALAENYVLLDNFHTGGAISFDGHHWLIQAFVSDYVERAFASSPRGYAWDLADALTVAPAGFFLHSGPTPLNVRIFGETCLPARWDPARQSAQDMNEKGLLSWSEYWRLYKEGKWQNAVGCAPGVPALGSIVSRRYPNNSTSITDQIRAEEFLRELAEREKSGEMPHVVVLTLGSDHTNGTNPKSPTPRAMVADNDLALGRIVEGISKSRFWPKSLILVVEDDAQNGLDHVDGHRTVALAAGPYVRRNVVDSNHYNHTSMVRTIRKTY